MASELPEIQTTPHQYHLLRKLDASGCPVDWDALQPPYYPLRIVHERSALGTEVIPLETGSGLLWKLSMTPAVSISLAFRLWCSPEMGKSSWTDRMQYPKENGGGEVRVNYYESLNRVFRNRWKLEKGRTFSGYLALELSGRLAPTSSRAIKVWFEDGTGATYPYDFELNASQKLTGVGDADCRFVSAEELERERAEEAAKAVRRANRRNSSHLN